MKNKKLLKALASFMLSGAAAVGCFALFGCHSHTYSGDWVNTDPDKHWHAATCGHDDERADEAEHDFDANGKCTVCKYQKPQTEDPAAALAKAKTDAKAELAAYKKASDYTTNATALADAISAGNTAIDAATTTEGVATALANAKTAIDAIKSDAKLAEEAAAAAAAALAKAKTDAKAELAAYKKTEDYTTNAKALEDAISAGNTAIDAATTTEGVATALANAKAEIDKIKSDAELGGGGGDEDAAAKLAKAKTDAKAELTAYKKAEDYTKNAAAFEKAISDGKIAIDDATTTEGVATALAAAKAAIDEIKTDAELGGDEEADSYTVTFDMHNIGTAPAAQTVNKDGYATEPETAPTATNYYFVGWYTDETYETEFDFENTAITKTTTVYACWSEDIKSTVTIPTVSSNTTLTEDVTIGKVTFSASGRWESGLIYNANSGKREVVFELSGSTNSISFSACGASSSAKTVISLIQVDGSTEKTIQTFKEVANKEYLPDAGSTAEIVTIDGLSAGTYKLKASVSYRINNISITERMVVADPDSIKVTPSVVDFVIGSEFSSEGLQTVLHYKNGREDVLTNVSVNKDAYKKDVAGKYPITVSYTLAGSTTPFTDTYYVYVYGVDSIALKTNATKQEGKTPAGNGTYINHAAQQVYFVGDKLNLDGYTVHLNSSVTVEGEEKKEKLFLYTPTATNFTGFDSTEAGTKTVTLHAYDLSVEFDVIVMTAPDLSEESFITIYVSQRLGDNDVKSEIKTNLELSDDEIVVGKYYAEQKTCFFETIQQALDFLELANLDANASKGILLDIGTYREKLEITIPNLVITGVDLKDLASTERVNPDDIKIEWNSLYGVADESGYVQTTDSTATLNVRASATGFRISDVTISNYFNCEENFYKEFGIGYGEHRALAMLIQADKVAIKNCKLLGYQDTLELFTGRQIIEDTYISGTTDFIFGYNNTTRFLNCTIHSIKRWKKTLDKETGEPVLETDGGYITAFKGNNKDANDYVQYGAIFDSCHFTADEGVAEGNTAIARPWGAYAAVAVINSELGAHISKTGYTSGTEKNQRYVMMKPNNPTDSTVKFVEYGNYGAGAITEKVDGMKFLSDSEMLNYSKSSVIFGKTNGGLTYDEAWSGSFQIVTITITLGDKSEKIYGYWGGTIPQAAIDAAVAKLLDSGKELATLTYGDNQPFTADTIIDHGMQVTATQKDKEITAVTVGIGFEYEDIAANTALASASDKNNGVATVTTLCAFTKKNNAITDEGTSASLSYAAQIQCGGGNNAEIIKFELASGYTYSVKVYCGSSGSARKMTLNDVEKSSGGSSKTFLNLEWANLSAGTYNLKQSANCIIAYIEIVATPVAA